MKTETKPANGGNGCDPLDLLTVDQVAKLLKMSPEFIKREYLAGRLAHVKLGKCVRFERRQVWQYVMDRRSCG